MGLLTTLAAYAFAVIILMLLAAAIVAPIAAALLIYCARRERGWNAVPKGEDSECLEQGTDRLVCDGPGVYWCAGAGGRPTKILCGEETE